MPKEDLKRFLIDLKSNKELFETISNVGTANEIALIANKFGYKFNGEDLKNFSNTSYHRYYIFQEIFRMYQML